LKKRNVQPVWIMETKDLELLERSKGQISHWFGQSMKTVAELLQSCSVIVANDSMPAHMGGTLARPTLALMGPTKPSVFAHMSSVLPMQTSLVDCVGCHFGKPWRVACDLMCQALAMLSPQLVADTVCHIVETAGTIADRELCDTKSF
jgi:hypothetical protein